MCAVKDRSCQGADTAAHEMSLDLDVVAAGELRVRANTMRGHDNPGAIDTRRPVAGVHS